MILYESSASGNCFKVRLLLGQLGISYERVELDVIDRSDRPQRLGALNPALRVPTLVLDDGRPLAESGAILWYFGDGTQYVPEDPYARAQVLQWMFFEQYCVEPNIAVLRFWKKIAELTPGPGEEKAKADAGAAALAAMESYITGKEFFVGEAYTIADIALYGYTHVADEGGFDLGLYPELMAWMTRVEDQDGFVRIGD